MTALVGIDEVGRGALAGPVVAAAVRIEAAFYERGAKRRMVRRVTDSKKLSAAQRAGIVAEFREILATGSMRIAYGLAEIGEIERHNISGATRLAMGRAAADLMLEGELLSRETEDKPPGGVHVLIDGRPLRGFVCGHEAVVGGDAKSLAVALASIHAKEWRDALLVELDSRFPAYGFARHKGYGTREHRAAILRHGACPLHRPSFLRKLREMAPERKSLSEDSLFSHSTPTRK